MRPGKPLAWLLIIYAATAWVWNPLAPWVSWEGLSATAGTAVRRRAAAAERTPPFQARDAEPLKLARVMS